MITQRSLTLLLASVITTASLSAREYVADPLESQWRMFSEPGQAFCQLEHTIPGYGQASFNAKAGDPDIIFRLKPLSRSKQSGKVYIKATPPPWMPGKRSYDLEPTTFYSGHGIELSEDRSMELISWLQNDQLIAFSYFNSHADRDLITAYLSPSGFKDSYSSFLECYNDKAPRDIHSKQKVLNFLLSRVELDTKSDRKLARVIDNLQYDEDLKAIIIRSYTDTIGHRHHNKKLARERAHFIADKLIKAGFPESNLSIEVVGERRFIEGNDDRQGRAMNRRVVLVFER